MCFSTSKTRCPEPFPPSLYFVLFGVSSFAFFTTAGLYFQNHSLLLASELLLVRTFITGISLIVSALCSAGDILGNSGTGCELLGVDELRDCVNTRIGLTYMEWVNNIPGKRVYQ
jgi:hypothetical protein